MSSLTASAATASAATAGAATAGAATASATAGEALLRLLAAADAVDGGGRRVVRRLRITDVQPLRAAHPRAAAAVAALDWSWRDAARRGCVILDLRDARHAVRFAAYIAAAMPRAACPALFIFGPPSISAAEAAAECEAARRIVRVLPRTLCAAYIHGRARAADVDAFLVELCGRLRGMRVLDLSFEEQVSAAVLAALPRSLRYLNVSYTRFPRGGRTDHLDALATLQVSGTAFDDASLAATPRGLTHLFAQATQLSAAACFAHLPALRHLDVSRTNFADGTLASVPRRVRQLHASSTALAGGARFSHLPHLRALYVGSTRVGDAALASMPRRLEALFAADAAFTAAARFDHLPALRSLSVASTAVGDAARASMPRGLTYLDAEDTAITPAT